MRTALKKRGSLPLSETQRTPPYTTHLGKYLSEGGFLFMAKGKVLTIRKAVSTDWEDALQGVPFLETGTGVGRKNSY